MAQTVEALRYLADEPLYLAEYSALNDQVITFDGHLGNFQCLHSSNAQIRSEVGTAGLPLRRSEDGGNYC